MLSLELVYKALSRSKSFSFIFILNFSLAIASLSYLEFFKSSIDYSLDSKAKSLLGADLVIQSRFPITNEQIASIQSNLPKIKNFSQGISTVSMVSSNKRSRLMELVKINDSFPYYGGLTFHDGSSYPSNIEINSDEVWVYQEVLEQLELQLGHQVNIGEASFRISKIITDDSLKSVSFSGFVPKIYLSQEAFKKTKLLQFGSTARYSLHFQFEKTFDNEKLEEIENTLKTNLNKGLRTLSPNDGRDRLLGVLNFLTNFLSLVSLISFFLGLVGLIYLYSGFLRKHQKDITVLSDLGVSKQTIFMTYLLHLFTLIFISLFFVCLLILSSASFAEPLLQKLLGMEFVFSFDFSFFLSAFFILVLISISVSVALIQAFLQTQKHSSIKLALSFIPFVLLLLFVAHNVIISKYIGFFFALAVLGFILITFTAGYFLLKKFDFSGHSDSLALSLAIKNITRQKSTSLTLFTAILLCTTFFTLIPQIGSSLSNALTQLVDERPRFFVIDAQEDQLKALESKVKTMGAKLENISPMIRGRIIKINDTDFLTHTKNKQKEKSSSNQSNLHNTTVNISYRAQIKDSDKIVEGVAFSGKYDSEDFSKSVELSVEKRYAKRNAIKLGDSIVFDIMGLEIQTKVVNIRTVNWTEFTPNFFFLLQEGAINDAPKTILATISSGDYNSSKMLLNLADAFPSLTVIDVKNLLESFAKLVVQVTSITDKMSFYSIFIGLLMSFIIIQYQMNLQKNNILRLKMIGVKNSIIRNSFFIEYGLISFTASTVGIVLGSLSSYIISGLIFESYWEFRPIMLLSYFLLIPIITLIVVSVFTKKVIHQKENHLFGE